MTKKTVAVIGAGVMGCDLALDLSGHGYPVILKDLTPDILTRAEKTIRRNYKFFTLMKKGIFSSGVEDLLARVTFVTDYKGFDRVDMVIENITEDLDSKAKVYRELGAVCRDNVIYGVNTSCLSITRVASFLPRPENVIGLHFLNPVPLKPLVEVIRGWHTSEKTLEEAKTFLKNLGKTWVEARDFPGFATNRVLMLTINECAWVVQDGVAEARDVDRIFKEGFGHRMGPLATADLIGLDTVLRSLRVLQESYGDPKYRPCPLLVKLVDAGCLGKKSGRGFFCYEGS